MYNITRTYFNFQNTYTNAEKLLTAAEELSQTGECDASDICSVAAELESHVAAFAARVQARRRRLQRAVNFYTHQSEVKIKKQNCGVILFLFFDKFDVSLS